MAASIDKRRQPVFRPGLAQTLAGAALLSLLLALGVWQLRRADEKAALLAAEAAARQAVPVAVTTLSAAPLPRHASAEGHYDLHLFLLDNRVAKGRAGYELLAPLRLSDGRAVLVDLGWWPQGADRSQLPAIPVPAGEVAVIGLAVTPAAPPFELSPREAMAPGWPKVVQAAVPARLAATLGYRLLPVVLYPDGSDVAARRLATLNRFGPERHRAYAVQWFVMAMVLVGIYLHHGFQRGRTA